MNSDAEHFIDLATRPLDRNPELKHEAEALLRDAIDANGDKQPGSLKEAADSLEQADARPRGIRWRMVLAGIMGLVSLPLLFLTVSQLKESGKAPGMFNRSVISDSSQLEIPGLDAQQSLLLSGKAGATSESGKWKPLWESDPKNPAFLIEYASAYFREHKKLSPEIIAAAERVDPDNGWIPALVAAGLAEGSVRRERVPYSYGAKTPPKAPVWIIEDETRLNEALAAIHQFVSKPKLVSYQTDLLRERIPLIPAREDFMSQFPLALYLKSQPNAGLGLRKITDILAAGAQQCAARGDAAGFEQIVADWKALVSRMCEGSESMIDLLIAKAFHTIPLANFRDAALALDREEDAEHFAKLHERDLQEKEDRKTGDQKSYERYALITRRGSMMASMTLPMLDRQIRNPPALTDSDLKPARHSEHAFFERLGSWLAWVLFGLCAIVAWLSRHRRKPMILILSDRLQGLVRPSDRAWMIAGGILVPLVWYFIVTRLTPLSAREWSARMTLFIQPGGQFGCMVLSMIILTVQLAGWRLAKRGASLGLVPRHSWMGWAAAGSALLGVPVFGGLMLPEIGWLFVNVAQVLAGVAMVWLFAWFSFEILGKASRNLRRAILARAVSPVWILGMLVMAVLTPYFHFEEKKWILQDQVGEITADAPAASRYEYGVSQILKDELLQTIGR